MIERLPSAEGVAAAAKRIADLVTRTPLLPPPSPVRKNLTQPWSRQSKYTGRGTPRTWQYTHWIAGSRLAAHLTRRHPPRGSCLATEMQACVSTLVMIPPFTNDFA